MYLSKKNYENTHKIEDANRVNKIYSNETQ